MIIVDTREQKNQFILEYFEAHGIEYRINKLDVGDYSLEGSPHFSIDRKANVQELVGNMIHDHERLSKEIQRAIDNKVDLVFLIEDENIKCLDDLIDWHNYRRKWSPKATEGEQLLKCINTMIDHRYNNYDYSLRFLFTDHEHYASVLVRLLEAHKDE